MKELFLDSANLDEIVRCMRTDAVAGVTTNPSLMAKEQKGNYFQKLEEICQVIKNNAISTKHLSVEVIGLDPDQMIIQAKKIFSMIGDRQGVKLFVKIPITFETLRVISHLKDNGVRTNATAAITAMQAKLAHDAGADIISFFYRRGTDYNQPMDIEISEFSRYNRNARVICGSIRTPKDVMDCWNYGADIVTAPFKVIEDMTKHPKTDEAIASFQRDIDAWRS